MLVPLLFFLEGLSLEVDPIPNSTLYWKNLSSQKIQNKNNPKVSFPKV